MNIFLAKKLRSFQNRNGHLAPNPISGKVVLFLNLCLKIVGGSFTFCEVLLAPSRLNPHTTCQCFIMWNIFLVRLLIIVDSRFLS